MEEYQKFLEQKQWKMENSGVDVSQDDLHPMLFGFQKDIIKWALKRGRACVFAGCGLGKTLISLEWARFISEDILILCPLAVAPQTVAEGKKIGVEVNYCRDSNQLRSGINITNYEMADKFKLSSFPGIIVDEASILSNFEGAFRNYIIESCADTPYKLALTATPARNDFMELGNHSEFVGAMKRSEMLSMFFVHDGGETQKWRLKGHAQKEFWKWVASWAVMLQKPSDLGYEDGKFTLPPLVTKQVTVKTKKTNGYLFPMEAKTLQERIQARAATVEERAQVCADIVAQAEDEPFACWCNLNKESELLAKLIPGSIEIRGSHSREYKEAAIQWFKEELCDCALASIAKRKIPISCYCGGVKKKRVLISKGSIFGYGINLQLCRNTAFVGLSDSFELLYQTVRRFYRFLQEREVRVWLITADIEGQVLKNIQRKEKDSEQMAAEMVQYMHLINEANIKGITRSVSEYNPTQKMQLPNFLIQ